MATERSNPGDAPHFATTHWSIVLAAGRRDSPAADEALATLCGTYWYPLYAFVRRLGHQPDNARDLTQEFFSRLLEKDYLRAAQPERGKFRTFLLSAFKHFLSKERDRAAAQKRGSGRQALPLDFESGDSRYSLEPAHDWTAEKIYERRWALTLLDQVLDRLRQEFVSSGKEKLFERLKDFLSGEEGLAPYRQVAADLHMTEGAVKVAVHRIRRRLRELLLAEIAQTVSHPDEVAEELRHLFAAIRSVES